MRARTTLESRVGSLWAALALAALVSAPAKARGEEAAERPVEPGAAAFLEGVDRFDAGLYEEALAAFERALELRPHPAVRLNVAWCLSRLDRPVAALAAFEAYLAEAGSEPEERVGPARFEAERLRGLLAELEVRVEPAGVEARVDGEPIAAAGRPVRLLPGRHVVTASASGRTAEEEVVLEAGERALVELRLPAEAGALRVEVLPARAAARVVVDEISLDGPEASLAPGPHQVSVSAPGHLGWQGEVSVSPGATSRLEVTLPRRGLAPAWLWSLVAVTAATAVAASVTGGLAVASHDAWQERWEESDRALGLGLRDATDGLFIALGVEAVTTLVVGLFTAFGPREPSARVVDE